MNKGEKNILQSRLNYQKKQKTATTLSLLLEQLEQTPNQVAVEFDSQTFTYKELYFNVSKLLSHLKAQTIKEDELVIILLPRGLSFVVSILGVLFSGGAYLPIDVNQPLERIDYIIRNSQAKYVITESEFDDRWSKNKFAGSVLNYLDLKEGTASINLKNELNLSPRSLAYVIYTSGSTGKPKGVMIEHQALKNLVYSLKDQVFSFNQPINIALLAPFFFDASVELLFYGLVKGHKIVIASEEITKNGQKLLDFYFEHQIILSDCVPTHLEMLVSANEFFDHRMTVKEFSCGGEVLTKNLVKRFYKNCNDNFSPCITNTYGPTEACVDASFFKITKQTECTNEIIPIGKPLNNYEIVILNDSLQEVEPYVKGEICISGSGLARGYLNNEQQTQERFVYLKRDQQEVRVYRTGDYGYKLPDGTLNFDCRLDDQVKIRGYRIGLNEIEEVLLNYPDATRAAVLLKEKQLVGFFTSEEKVNVSEFRSFIAKKLPTYMIPTHLIQVDEFPQFDNGKIDKKKLLEHETLILTLNEFDNLPEIQRGLCKAWSQTIQSTNFNITDSFFDSGGDSLTIIQFLQDVNKKYDTNLTIADIFQYYSIQKLEKIILSRIKGESNE